LVYEAILELFEDREAIDLVTVSDQLKKAKALKKVGGKVFLAELLEKVPTAAHSEYYAKIVRDCAIKRELISSASNRAVVLAV